MNGFDRIILLGLELNFKGFDPIEFEGVLGVGFRVYTWSGEEIEAYPGTDDKETVATMRLKGEFVADSSCGDGKIN